MMRRPMTILAALTCTALCLLLATPQSGQTPPDLAQIFEKRDAMIPMRDGVRLHTEIYILKNAAAPLPFLITRTPYGTNDDKDGFSRLLNIYQEMIPEGYIFVMQDIRGRYGSEGKFVMQRPVRDRRDPQSIDEGTDTYDTIDWLLKGVPNNNGRAGLLGISYGGWLTVMAMLEPHPALKAVSEQASPADMFLGDDFHHNGAFRLSYGFEYAAEMETSKTNYFFAFDKYDLFEWYLALGPLSNANGKYFHGNIPTWNDFVKHANYDAFWQKQAVTPYLKEVTVPNLNVAGWWDQEDFYGPVKIYETLEAHDTKHWNYLVVGPWNHGGWARSDLSSLGKVQFGSNTSLYFRQNVQAPWFAYWLKDKGRLRLHEALTFETGSNRWEQYDAWPQWLVEDQRFVHKRPDTLSWETEPLEEDVVVAGDIAAHLFASTTGTDSDWIVKLIDVYPEQYSPDPTMGGYQLMIANEVFRGRFRKSFERPEPLPANQVVPYTIDLHTNDHCFQKGHRIMVQVQSTWFPLIDRNPQRFVPNIFQATSADYQKATQRVYRSKRFSSHVELPVVQR